MYLSFNSTKIFHAIHHFLYIYLYYSRTLEHAHDQLMEAVMEEKINLGVSTCLLGEKVRYDGQHKWDRFITDTLGKFVRFVPVCPEVECGLPTPREAMRLVGDPENPRLVTQKTSIDHTDRMLRWGAKRLKELERENLCGFIFKSKSPSSGMERIKVYNDKGHPSPTGTGIWARMFTEHFPLLPVEDEGRLHDPALRENFIERIFIYRRWRDMTGKGERHGSLVDFHTKHKLLLMAHSPQLLRTLGGLVSEGKKRAAGELFQEYEILMAQALKLIATAKKNTNVLHHAMGYFKKELTSPEKQELRDVIDSYHAGHIPLIVPVTLINHYVLKYEQAYLKDQYYLNPHPLELRLRNHV